MKEIRPGEKWRGKRILEMTPKHAHFLIDFYGKRCNNKEKAEKLFESIIRIWNN